MSNLRRGLGRLALALSLVAWPCVSHARDVSHAQDVGHAQATLSPAAANAPAVPSIVPSIIYAEAAALPDAPRAQPGAGSSQLHLGSGEPAPRYARVIDSGQTAAPLTSGEKVIYSLRGSASPINIVTSLYSAGYEQLRGTDPKYGSDSGAGAAKFGASMAHSASTAIFADGVFAAAFHQDPRYYRIGSGSIWVRGLRSAEQALVRRGDDGDEEINSSGLAGRAASAALTLAYYPPASRKAGVVLSTFAVSIATDAGGNLVLEFFSDIARKYPILKKFEVR